jgi:hypothetical protein
VRLIVGSVAFSVNALLAAQKVQSVMQRLISFFHEPQDDWPDPASLDVSEPAPGETPALKAEPKEPLYFAELMAYVRERNQKFRWPREGAD